MLETRDTANTANITNDTAQAAGQNNHAGAWTGSQQTASSGIPSAVEEALEAAFAAATKANARYDQQPYQQRPQRGMHRPHTQLAPQAMTAVETSPSQTQTPIDPSAITIGDASTLAWLESQEASFDQNSLAVSFGAAGAPASAFEQTSADETEKADLPTNAPTLAATIKPPTVTDSHAIAAWRTAVANAEAQKTTVRTTAIERSQKLRTMDDYEKPEDVSMVDWFKTATREWCAQQHLTIISTIFGQDDARLLPALDALAQLSHQRRHIHEAEHLHQRALALRERTFGKGHESCAVNLEGLAKISHDQGRYEDAERLFEEIIEIHEKSVRKNQFFNSNGVVSDSVRERAIIKLLTATNQLAQLLAEQDKFVDSESRFKRALEAWNNFEGTNSEELSAVVQTLLGNYRELVQRQQNDWDANQVGVETMILR